jgi:hypothetical protein
MRSFCSARTACLLISYYGTSSALTLYLKWVESYFAFPFPLTLICVQMLMTLGLVRCLAARCWLPPPPHPDASLPSFRDPRFLRRGVPIGLLNAADIGCSVAAFVYVDVAFFEVVKSTCAVWLLLTAFALGTERPSWLLAAVVGLNATGLAFTSRGQAAFSM